jgi:hypothetical protein
MKVSIHGAAGGEVTGSAYLVESKHAKVLVDCGLFQGQRRLENYNRLPSKRAMKNLNAVVLTHAHLDHTGRLPLLTKAEYDGPVFATPATIDIADLILRDSAHLQKSEFERASRHRNRQARPPREPLYSARDVQALRDLYQPLQANRPKEIAPGVSLRVVEAGHMLGSVSAELTVEENGRRQVLVFPATSARAARLCIGIRCHSSMPILCSWNPRTAIEIIARSARRQSRLERSCGKLSKRVGRYLFLPLRSAARSCCSICWRARFNAENCRSFPCILTALGDRGYEDLQQARRIVR